MVTDKAVASHFVMEGRGEGGSGALTLVTDRVVASHLVLEGRDEGEQRRIDRYKLHVSIGKGVWDTLPL